MSDPEIWTHLEAVSGHPLAVITYGALSLKFIINGMKSKLKSISEDIASINKQLAKINDRCLGHAERISRLEGSQT